jgi:hypothetical protein
VFEGVRLFYSVLIISTSLTLTFRPDAGRIHKVVNTLFSFRHPCFEAWRPDPVIRECAGVHGGLVLQIRRGVISQGRMQEKRGCTVNLFVALTNAECHSDQHLSV